MTDYAADNYYSRHDGTEDTEPEGDDLVPMPATPAPLTDTDAALTRIQGIARLAGLVVRVGADPVRDAALAFRAVEHTGEWQDVTWWAAMYHLRDACDREVSL